MTGHGSPPDPRREDDDGRKVAKPTALGNEGWKDVGPNVSVSGYYGKMTGMEKPVRGDAGHAVTSWVSKPTAGPEEHYAMVEHETPSGLTGAGVDVATYAMGPLRTKLRAQIAASSLSARVEGGRQSRLERFHTGTQHWTYGELEGGRY